MKFHKPAPLTPPGDVSRALGVVRSTVGRIAALVLSGIFAAAPVAGADDDPRVFAVFGGSMSTATDDDGEDAFSVHYRKGLSRAVGFEYVLTDLIDLQLRAGYHQNGADVTSGEVGSRACWEFDYFEFSALTRLGNGLFHGLVGVSTGVAWGCSIKGQSQGFDQTTDCLRTESAKLSALDFGLLAGIGTPEWNRKISQYLDVGKDPVPDVVVEVDSTTDVRRNRLKLYEEWGFPELWVEVPNAFARGRPAGLRSGLRIYLLEGDRYVLSEESRALPGWRAAEIHRALNEWALSEETSAVLSRVGEALGEGEGTGPEDDPLLRQQRAEGRMEGRAEDRAAMVQALLRQRNVSVPPDFPEGLAIRDLDALRAASAERLLDAASAADSVADFLTRLDDPDS